MANLRQLMAEAHINRMLADLPPDGLFVEWGSGGGTLALLRGMVSSQRLHSIEHDNRWAMVVCQEIQAMDEDHGRRHVMAHFHGSKVGDNASPWEECPAQVATEYLLPSYTLINAASVVLVDGVARGAVLAANRHRFKPGCIVYLHDAQRRWYDWAMALYPPGERIEPPPGQYPPTLWRTVVPPRAYQQC